jgi:succinate-semialdehyde dehydrogenase / glutarate-semialdehyde dehydrogenase
MSLQSINPTTGEFIESFDEISDAELEAALERAEQAFRVYRSTSFDERASWLNKAAHILEDEKDMWARLR